MSDTDLRTCLPETGNNSKIIKALISARKDIRNPTKNSKGHNYKYSDLSETLGVIEVPLLENDLLLTQNIYTNEKSIGLNTIIYHSSGEKLENSFSVPSASKSLNKGNDLQEFGSLITYLKRYALTSIFCLGTDDDDGAAFNVKKMQQPSRAPSNYNKELNELKKQVANVFDEKQTPIDTVKDKLALMKPYDLKKVLELSKQDGTAMIDFISEFKGK